VVFWEAIQELRAKKAVSQELRDQPVEKGELQARQERPADKAEKAESQVPQKGAAARQGQPADKAEPQVQAAAQEAALRVVVSWKNAAKTATA
jgi:hypothetical protein